MKKAVIVLNVFVLIVSSCGQTTKTQREIINNETVAETSSGTVELQDDEEVPFNYRTLPAEWAELTYSCFKFRIYRCKYRIARRFDF